MNIRQIQGKKTVVDSLIEEGQSVLKLIQEEEKYKGLRNSLAYMLTQKRKLSKEDFMQNLEGFEKDIFEKDTPTINSFNALSDFLYAKATYYHLIGNYASYFKYSRERIELWEQQKQLSNANQFEYIILLQSFINSTIYHGRFDLTEAYIEKQVAKANREQSFTSIRAYSVYLCRFLYYFNTKQPEKTKELAKDIVKLLKENNLHPKYQLALQINMVSFFFVCEEWKNCLFWIESIISKKYGEHRRDLQNIARIYKLIALYEIGDSDQLDNQFRSIKRYFNLHGKIKKHNYAWALFEGLKNTHLAIPGRNKHTAIEALHNYVQAKRKSPDKELAGLHEISLWLQSKLQQKNILFLLNS